jgi:hypothetical protein
MQRAAGGGGPGPRPPAPSPTVILGIRTIVLQLDPLCVRTVRPCASSLATSAFRLAHSTYYAHTRLHERHVHAHTRVTSPMRPAAPYRKRLSHGRRRE